MIGDLFCNRAQTRPHAGEPMLADLFHFDPWNLQYLLPDVFVMQHAAAGEREMHVESPARSKMEDATNRISAQYRAVDFTCNHSRIKAAKWKS